MKQKVVSYKTAMALKAKGFNEPTEFCYWGRETSLHMIAPHFTNESLGEGKCSAPTIDEVRQWLADKHEIFIELIYYFRYQKSKNGFYRWGAIMMKKNNYRVAENCAQWDDSLRDAVETIVNNEL